jgi:hypothetical protein
MIIQESTCNWNWHQNSGWWWEDSSSPPSNIHCCKQQMPEKVAKQVVLGPIWLMLGGGTVQIVPCKWDHFLIYWVPHLSYNHSWFIHQSSLLWFQQIHLVAKQVETGREIAAEFCLSQGTFWTCHKILYKINSFTPPPTEVVPRIFIALKNPSLLAGFEPVNLGSNGKHDNHYTTKDV